MDSRTRLASSLHRAGKHTEAEKEYRAVFSTNERVRGPEDLHTLYSRANVASILEIQGKHAEAEKEYRAVLALHERVQGAAHGNVFRSCYVLALCLEKQHNLKEALELLERAEAGWANLPKALQPPSMDAKAARERIQAALKK